MTQTHDTIHQGTQQMFRALTIAGSDSGGGAGIQADLKTFAALDVYGLSAVTSVTAQNTLGVRAIQELSAELVTAQIDAVLEDIGADAAKTGMLSSTSIIEATATCVKRWRLRLVVDPVMVAKGGDALLQSEAVQTLSTVLLPLAEVITPNLFEAEMLTGQRIETLDDMRTAAQVIHALGPRHVIVKGGHLSAEPVDVYFDGKHYVELRADRIPTKHTHGTGCTFSAALTAYIARGLPVAEAVVQAKQYITEAIRHAPGLGHGQGPLGHFWQWHQAREKQENSSSGSFEDPSSHPVR